MDTIYTGLKELIQENDLSVQDSFPLRTSVDQRGEQVVSIYYYLVSIN